MGSPMRRRRDRNLPHSHRTFRRQYFPGSCDAVGEWCSGGLNRYSQPDEPCGRSERSGCHLSHPCACNDGCPEPDQSLGTWFGGALIWNICRASGRSVAAPRWQAQHSYVPARPNAGIGWCAPRLWREQPQDDATEELYGDGHGYVRNRIALNLCRFDSSVIRRERSPH